jgi:parallel beta-helix repeat protein
MKKAAKRAGFLFLLTTLLGVFGSPVLIRKAHLEPATWTVNGAGSADFRTIQDAINAAQHGDFINVSRGVYQEHVTINRSVSLVGENKNTTIIDGGGSGTVVLVTVDNVTLGGFTVRNGNSGIIVLSSRNCTVKENFVAGNKERGILITMSRDCTVHRNHACGSPEGYGINVNASQNVLVEDNGASNNNGLDGIGLLSSSNSIVRGNTVNGNKLGIWVDKSSSNRVYLNNVFDNGKQTSDNTLLNSWDNGSNGNYYSDYQGADTDGNGVGDEPHVVDENGQVDRFPLIRPYINEVYLSVDVTPPVVAFTYSPDMLFANDTVTFDATESYDSVGPHAIVAYVWHFGDGSTGAGEQTSHTYLAPGNFTVVLTVVDVAGNEGFAAVNLLIELVDADNGQFPLAAALAVLVIGGVVGVGVLMLWFKRSEKSSS